MNNELRFAREAGAELFTGSELLLKGALETEGGVHLYTGCPGLMVAGFFDAMRIVAPLLQEKGVSSRVAGNETLATGMLQGVQLAGGRGLMVVSADGLHRATDALRHLLQHPTTQESGGVIAMAEDTHASLSPATDATTTDASANDVRFLAEHLSLPLLEPCSPQEIKDYVNLAFKLGRAGQVNVGLLVQSKLALGGGSVECRPHHWPRIHAHQRRAMLQENHGEVSAGRGTGSHESSRAARWNALLHEARKLGINRIAHRPNKDEVVPLGLIASGMAYAFLSQALSDMGLTGKLPILKIGLPYPLDEQLVSEFAAHCEQIIVIEERRGFVERQVLEALRTQGADGTAAIPQIFGKRFPRQKPGIPERRLHPSMLIELLVPIVREHPTLPVELTNGRLTAELQRISRTTTSDSSNVAALPERSPSFCPGCPHRDSSSVLLELQRDLRDPLYMLKNHRAKPVELICHSDGGCSSLLALEPNHALVASSPGKGASGAVGGGTYGGASGGVYGGFSGGVSGGTESLVESRHLAFMGDGTFFHSGQAAISHSIKTGQDITYLILENKTAAFSGQHPHAGSETSITGQQGLAQDIERIVTAMIPRKLAKDVSVVRIDPSDRDRHRKLLEQTVLAPGVKVIIADKECGLTFHQRAAEEKKVTEFREGFLPRQSFMSVATEVCDHCHECTRLTGCSGLKIVPTDYGPKVQTDLENCVNDGACQRLQACPSFEQVTIIRRQAPRRGDDRFEPLPMPDVPRPIHAEQETWRCWIAGISGPGDDLTLRVLATAGRQMGYHVQFTLRRGAGIRGGSMVGQLLFARAGASPAANQSCATATIPHGKADLLLGLDLLEAARAVDPTQQARIASEDRTAAVLNTARHPTLRELLGHADEDVARLVRRVQERTQQESFAACDASDICRRLFDVPHHGELVLLGLAFQRGLIPVTPAAIESALREVGPSDAAARQRAFDLGRKIERDESLPIWESGVERETPRRAFRRKVGLLRSRFGWLRDAAGKRAGKDYRTVLKEVFRLARTKQWDDHLLRDVIIRTYDCHLWGGVEHARKYCDLLMRVGRGDEASLGHEVTRTLAWNLARVMCIKDEVFVAALLTSSDKYRRDRKRFNVNLAAGDRIIYRHHHRPEIDLWGWKIRFDWASRDWQLWLLARMRWLRTGLPSWHAEEQAFRDWYIQLLEQMLREGLPNEVERRRWLEILRLPEQVTGFRDVRHPRMEAARRTATELLGAEASRFVSQAVPSSLLAPMPGTDSAPRSISLPVAAPSRA